MNKKTIVMLSAKRVGSTAMFKAFQKHPDVGVCYRDANIDNWEPNFWNLAWDAIEGSVGGFIERFSESHPFLTFPEKFTKQSVFELWEQILEEQGPILFDKSPQYLGHPSLKLLFEYKTRGNDVRIFGLIRDPRDAITSQFELWNEYVDGDSPKKREQSWLEKYQHLEKILENESFLPLIRYEDFSAAPQCYGRLIFDYCGIDYFSESFDHIKPVSIGRYTLSLDPRVKNWNFSDQFEKHLQKYGYSDKQLAFSTQVVEQVKSIPEQLKRALPFNVKEKIKSTVEKL